MAAQTNVQQLIQSLVPSGVNNGNPNTIYNTSVSPAASMGALNLPAINSALTPWVAPATAPVQGPYLPQMAYDRSGGTGGGGGGGAPGVPAGPPVLPPVTAPGVGTPVAGPVPQTGLGGTTTQPRLPRTVESGRFGWGPPIVGAGPLAGGGGNTVGDGMGNIQWQQLLDMIIPGDAYQSNRGQWDVSNTLLGLADAYQPGAQWAIETGGSLSDADWYFDHILDNAKENMASNQNQVNDATNASVAKSIESILDEMYGGPDKASTRPARSSQAAGATTIAEGRAAQNMVGDMQLQYFLNSLKKQSQERMNPRFKYER